ncbi:MAG TPA: hypothetical protein VNH11_19315 [Pirellulales bacterium]|nr:hypothetical protein [Pirellulales bacterium]
MNQQDLVEMLRQRPFQPFHIHVSDGAVYDIRHPEMMMVDRSKALVFFPPSDRSLPVIERYEAVSLAHMTRLEPIQYTSA